MRAISCLKPAAGRSVSVINSSSCTSCAVVASFLTCSFRSCSTQDKSTGFDVEAFSKEQQRRRTTEPRKAFWNSPSSTAENQAASLSAPSEAAASSSSSSSSAPLPQRPLYGRDTMELIERVQSVQHAGVARDEKLRLARRREAEQQKGKKDDTATDRPPQSQAEARLASLYNTYAATSASAKARASAAAASARSKATGGGGGSVAGAAKTSSKAETADEIVDEDEIKKQAELAERKEKLRFRELDNELDRVRVGRDLFQWVNYLRKGESYAIDNELEREMRYFPEHVAAELKMNVKFLTGGSQLARPSTSFPTLAELTKMTSAAKREFDSDRVTESTHFAVPTVVFMSQFTHASLEAADIVPVYAQLLREALLGTGVYAANALPKAPGAPPPAQASAAASPSPPGSSSSSPSTKSAATSLLDKIDSRLSEAKALQLIEDILVASPSGVSKKDVPANSNSSSAGSGSVVDVLFLKTVDFDSGLWTKNWLSRLHGARMLPALADRTFVGAHLVRKFASIGLRNYGAHYVFLVDHQGKIRWMSTALPTENEAKWFLEHIRTLVRASITAKAK